MIVSNRREFLRICAILGLTLPAMGCAAPGRSVIVVGAGAAGLTAAHLLTQAGVEVRVLEAGPTHGGRMRRTLDFVDFPVPLGAEWLHTDAAVLASIAGDREVDIDLIGYGPGEQTGDLKFVNSSWFDFFEEYIVPGIAERLQFGRQVVRIDSSRDRVAITDALGVVVEADAVIVTVPVTILRNRDITFVPDLSRDRWAALDSVDVWGGIKVFIEFDQRFYPTFLTFPDSDSDAGQRLYYDAAHGQNTEANVLGLFAVGQPAKPYQELDDEALRNHMLAELDEIFDGAASRGYRRHIAQDWSAESFIRQAYVADGADWQQVRTVGEPASDRVLFAGDAYTDGEDWSSVHVAAASAQTAVGHLLRNL